MQIILLSGGSGTRLWPLSNDARSKQFLRLLSPQGQESTSSTSATTSSIQPSTIQSPPTLTSSSYLDGGQAISANSDAMQLESMVQRVLRQIRDARLDASVTFATSEIQQDAILSQLGSEVEVVTEPSRRDTFPAICLACEYLAKKKACRSDEVVIVMPCDSFTEAGYFNTLREMARCIDAGDADMALMGIRPTYPSTKFGYIVPGSPVGTDGALAVKRFTEKPDMSTARQLITDGAFWNGGVFAFRLGYLTEIAGQYADYPTFEEVRQHYTDFPKISFDYQVVEKASHLAMLPFSGLWKDLGTWNSLTEELHDNYYGNVVDDGGNKDTHAINELDIPMIVAGTANLIVAASPDGILIADKEKSEGIKETAATIKLRPMYEERRWGTYKVIDTVTYPDGFSALTKHLTLKPGAGISYQVHACRDEVWTFIDGEGEVMIDGERRPVSRGTTVHIPKGVRHALRAFTELSFIEVQSGTNLVESDITRFPLDWD